MLNPPPTEERARVLRTPDGPRPAESAHVAERNGPPVMSSQTSLTTTRSHQRWRPPQRNGLPLSSSVALVTGGGRGFGLNVARA